MPGALQSQLLTHISTVLYSAFTLCWTLLYCTGIYCTVLQFAGDAMVPLADIFNQKASVVLLGDAWGVAELAADPHPHCTVWYFTVLLCTLLYYTVLCR